MEYLPILTMGDINIYKLDEPRDEYIHLNYCIFINGELEAMPYYIKNNGVFISNSLHNILVKELKKIYI